MKKLSLLLAALLLFSAAACAAPVSEPAPPPSAAPSPTAAVTAAPPADPKDDYERALAYGFLPRELYYSTPDTPVTWYQYCSILWLMLNLYDESLLPEWGELTDGAPTAEIRRDGAMVTLLFAAKLMGYASFNAQPPAEFQAYADRVWDNVTMDYPIFDWDTPIDLGDGCSDANHVGPAYDFCLRRISVISGKPLLEFDESGDLRLEQPLTLREALASAARLYDSEYGPFISSVSDATLRLAENMPRASYDALPSWHGYTVPPRSWWYSPAAGETYAAEELELYASLGFDFLRAPLLFNDLFIDGDVSKPNRSAFMSLDALLTHAAERGIHICFDLHEMPGFTTNGTDDDDTLFADAEAQALFAEIWGAVAAYFRDVPSNLLSFNLLNEPHAQTGSELTDEMYANVMLKAIDAIRAQSPERLIIVSGVGVSWAEPCEGLKHARVAQGTSAYFLNNGASAWPLYYINKNMDGAKGDLTLNGEFAAGTSLTLSVMQYSGGSFELLADGARVAEFRIAGDVFDGTGLTVERGAELKAWEGEGGAYGWYTLHVPIDRDCSQIRFRERSGNSYELYSLTVDTPSASCAIMANSDFVSSETPPVLTLSADMTVTAEAEDTLFEMNESSLAALMEKYTLFTERTGQACMLLEFGFNSTIPYDVALLAADAFLSAAESRGLPWCSWYDDFGPIINLEAALIYVENSFGDDYRRTDAEYMELDGRFSCLEELMEVYKKHMK